MTKAPNAALEAALHRVFPFEAERSVLSLVSPAHSTDEGIEAELQLAWRWGARTEDVAKKTGTVLLVPASRIADTIAALGAIERAGKNYAERFAKNAALYAPSDCLPLVFDLGEDASERAYECWRESQLRSTGEEAWSTALQAAMHAAEQLFPAVEAKMLRVYDLRIPRHLVVLVAFFHALDALSLHAIREAAGVSLAGITQWFTPEGLERRPREGLDERLYWRFHSDPPEFVSILHGDSDGLHWGLWYDDPKELPALVASNYARDSAETHCRGLRTGLQAVREHLAETPSSESFPADYPLGFRRRLFRELLESTLDFELEALSADGLSLTAPWERADILGGFGPKLPAGKSAPERGVPPWRRGAVYLNDPPLALQWLRTARKLLEEGNPALALEVGRELHWLAIDSYRAEGLSLLVDAYRALGRDALAELALLHNEYRKLPSVDVY